MVGPCAPQKETQPAGVSSMFFWGIRRANPYTPAAPTGRKNNVVVGFSGVRQEFKGHWWCC